ncbi:MAG: hypothetical protein ACP5NS_04545 [Candidatus Pacearchaeota archaeon]
MVKQKNVEHFLEAKCIDLKKYNKNKKGFARLVELIIAIVVIITMLLITYQRNRPEQNATDISELARDILREVGADETLRNEVLNAQTNTVLMVQTMNFINNSLPDYLSFELRSCEASSACGQSLYVGNVYSAERIIGATTTYFNTVKLRLFIWS